MFHIQSMEGEGDSVMEEVDSEVVDSEVVDSAMEEVDSVGVKAKYN